MAEQTKATKRQLDRQAKWQIKGPYSIWPKGSDKPVKSGSGNDTRHRNWRRRAR